MSTRSTSAQFFSMRSGCWPNARSFLCARRAGIPEILHFLRASLGPVWPNICVTSTPDAYFFAFGRTSELVKSCNDVLRFTQRMLADFRQFLCARRAKFPGNLQLFRATFAEDLRDLDILLGLFCILTHCRLGEEIQRGFCGLRNVRWPNACKCCARGAPKLQNFCNFFARLRRKICVISTPDARLFGCQRTHDLVKRFEDVMRVVAHAGRVNATFVRAAR